MNFSEALIELKKGCKMTRTSFDDGIQYIRLDIENQTFKIRNSVDESDHTIGIKDILAEDWNIHEAPETEEQKAANVEEEAKAAEQEAVDSQPEEATAGEDTAAGDPTPPPPPSSQA